jgi:hypothetical protein
LIHTDAGGSLICDEVSAAGGPTLSFARELLEEARHPAAATIKQRRSEDGGDRYLSNGCGRCDAMFDPFELEYAIAAAQDLREVGSLTVLAQVSRTIAVWAPLHELVRPAALTRTEHHLAQTELPFIGLDQGEPGGRQRLAEHVVAVIR